MTLDLFFKIALFIIFFSFAYVISAYSKTAKTRHADKTTRIKMHHEHEVPLLLKLRQLFGIPFYLGLLLWTFAPATMAWSAVALPVWVRWLGVGIGVSAIFLNVWSHRTLRRELGDAFDPVLRLLEVPALVQSGPYAIVRHPIYLAFLLMLISVLPLTANWFIGFCGLAIIISVIAIRVPEEEKLLTHQFGDEYRQYRQQTGGLLPKLR